MCEVIQHPKFRYRQKIAAFDYDHTIVKPKSKSTFAKNVDDWMWLRPNVEPTIHRLYKKGYSILIFTNQHQQFKIAQIKMVLDTLDIPYKAFIMMDKAIKKPHPLCFQTHIAARKMSDKSFYVGDALGRPQDWGDVDKVFANNNNIVYYSPEEIFPFPQAPAIIIKTTANKELIIMVGYQGSGKSTFAEKHFGGKYEILQGDVLKTEAKISKHLRAQLSSGNSVVLDATNPSIKKRAVFIKIAKEHDATVRVIHVATTIEEALGRNAERDKPVPKIAFYLFRKNFEEPTRAEGIEEIITI